MKKYILAIACLMSAMTGFAQDALTISDASISKGESGNLEVVLTNPDTKFIACQFDFILPAGMDVKRLSSGAVSKKGFVLSDRSKNEEEEFEFNYTFAEVEANHYRVTMYNDTNAPFLGTSGTAIATISVTASADFAGGEGKIFAITLTNEDRQSVSPAEATFSVSETTGISNIENAEQFGGAIYNLAGQKVSKAQKGVFIQNGRKVVIK